MDFVNLCCTRVDSQIEVSSTVLNFLFLSLGIAVSAVALYILVDVYHALKDK